MSGFLWLVVAGWLVIVAAFVALARSRWRCASCQRIHSKTVALCECGQARPAPPSDDDTDQLAALVGASAVVPLRQWLEAARIGGKLSPETWELLGGAYAGVADRNLQRVQNYVDVLDELSRAEKKRLMQAAAASIAMRDGIDGQLELIAIGYEAATRTFEFTAHHEPAMLGVREPRQMPDLRAIVADGIDPAGNPVDTVRVVFIDAASAHREYARLTDEGAKVYIHDASGELAEVR